MANYADLTAEIHLTTQAQYDQMKQQLLDTGWAIDSEDTQNRIINASKTENLPGA